MDLSYSESRSLLGTEIGNQAHWTHKTLVVLAIAGGLRDITKRYLSETEKLHEFRYVIQREWKMLFGNETLQSELNYTLPSKRLPNDGRRFACDGKS